MEQGYDFETLAREIAKARLPLAQDPAAEAAEIVHKVVVAGVLSTKVRQDPRATIAAACRGVLAAAALLDLNLPAASVAILKRTAEFARELPVDPGDLMTWSMEGLAAIARVSGPETASKIDDAIEAELHGAGAVFRRLCERDS